MEQIKHLYIDNGLEFCFDKFNAFCNVEGISRYLIVFSTLQQNGVVKQMNETLIEKICCMLSNATLPKSFWREATSIAYLLVNRSPSSVIDKMTSEKV